MQEKEFKWDVTGEVDLAAFIRPWKGIEVSAPVEVNVTDTYYDTPGQYFFSCGVGIRQREAGKKLSLQVKVEPRVADSPFLERTEWPLAYHGVSNDPAGVNLALRLFFKNQWGFEPGVEFRAFVRLEDRRTKWVLNYQDGSAELSFDRCSVFSPDSGTSSGEWVEIELEQLTGSDEGFIEAGKRLSKIPGLTASSRNKLRKSLECLRLQNPGVKKPRVYPGMELHELLEGWLRYYLEEVRRQEIGVWMGLDNEFVHDMRVGLRKMRSFLKMLPDAVTVAESVRVENFFRRVALVLGGVRDNEVYLEKIEHFIPEELRTGMPGVISRLSTYGKQEREKSRKRVCRMLGSRLYQSGMRHVNDWVSTSILKGGYLTDSALPVEDSMRKTLGKLARDAEKSGWKFLEKKEKMSDEKIHCLRIRFKRLRYGLEFYSKCLTPSGMEVQKQLPAVQDAFGDYVDTFFLIEKSERWAEAVRLKNGAESLRFLLLGVSESIRNEKESLRQRMTEGTMALLGSPAWAAWRNELFPPMSSSNRV